MNEQFFFVTFVVAQYHLLMDMHMATALTTHRNLCGVFKNFTGDTRHSTMAERGRE